MADFASAASMPAKVGYVLALHNAFGKTSSAFKLKGRA